MLSHNRASNVLATFALSALLSGFVATLSANLMDDHGDQTAATTSLGKGRTCSSRPTSLLPRK